jgi:hypothetical protein
MPAVVPFVQTGAPRTTGLVEVGEDCLVGLLESATD